MRDSNIWRKQNGIPLVRIGGDSAGLGTRYFEDAVKDAEEESQDVVDAFFKSANEGFNDQKLLAKIYESRKKSTNVIEYDNDSNDEKVIASNTNLCEINNW